MYVISVTTRRVASYFKRISPFTHYTFIDTTFQHWTNSYSRGSHALYLELRQCPALPVTLRFRESNLRHAPSLLVTTPRRWPCALGPTVLGGFRTTRSQTKHKKSSGVSRHSNSGRLISSPTFYSLDHYTLSIPLIKHRIN